jgi:ion channel-forming bestrophin family protein
VFRNQTSYNRFWDGRNYLSVIITSVRNLARSFLACSYRSESSTKSYPQCSRLAERADTERVVRILIAILYATKNHLRAEWGAAIIPGTAINSNTGNAALYDEYGDLLPDGLEGLDHKGLGLPLQLSFFVEQYIKRSYDNGMFHAPQASQMQVQLNTLVDAYGRMETIRLTPIPVAHL